MTLENTKETKYHNFLLSNWCSGATVLSMLLNNHQQITCNGETFPFPGQNPETLMCSCSSPVIKCEFYKFVAKHFLVNGSYDKQYFSRVPYISDVAVLQRIFHSFYLTPFFRDMACNLISGYKDKIEYFIKLHEKFFDLACEFSQSTIYLDGTKSPRRVELFANYSNKPIRVLHSVRDGRKFVVSYMKAHKIPGKDISIVAKKWVDYIRMVELLLRRYPNIELKEIRHEDLCHKKESTIKDVCDFLGVEYTQEIFNFDDATHHLLGNAMKKKFDGTIFENDNWKSAYSKKTFDKVTDIQKSYLLKYNYLGSS